jgi:uncharacterized protein
MMQIRCRFSVVFVFVAVGFLIAAGVSALEVPYLAGRVNDQAKLLDDGFESQLEERLRLLEEETGAQVAVLTISTLEGDPLEDFSMRVVETWKLGREDADDGVLILVARDERRMRIEVGYGLEGVLTDAQSGRIIDHLMAPRFREGDFNGGIGAAVDAVSSAIRGEPVDLPERRTSSEGFNPGSFIFLLIFGLPFINIALAARGAAGWIVGIFLTPFFFAFPAAIFGLTAVGIPSASAHLAEDRGRSRNRITRWGFLGPIHRWRWRRRIQWRRLFRWRRQLRWGRCEWGLVGL